MDPGQGRPLTAECDDFGRATDQLDEFGRELAARRSLPAPGTRREEAGQRRHGEPAGEQAGREHNAGGRHDGSCDANRQGAGEQRNQRRLEAAQVQVLAGRPRPRPCARADRLCDSSRAPPARAARCARRPESAPGRARAERRRAR